jgi:predicted metal-binding protein
MYNKLLQHKTSNNIFNINLHLTIKPAHQVASDTSNFATKCQSGCKNYNKKYSCPPLSPSFDIFIPKYSYLHVLALKVFTQDYPATYNTIRMINVVIKSIQRKIFDFIAVELNSKNIDHKILENGSCRLCKKCNLQSSFPCKYPLKMRPSLEATGVDVNQLMLDCFGFSLQWYSKNDFPKYQCVVGGILTDTRLLFWDSLNEFRKMIDIDQ